MFWVIHLPPLPEEVVEEGDLYVLLADELLQVTDLLSLLLVSLEMVAPP
jgi:hypothetical protein